ncbi:MAG: DUF3105 domain-containing protein [Chloroflexota bacterium]
MARKTKTNTKAKKNKAQRETPVSARVRRQAERQEAARERSNRNRLLIGSAACLVALVGLFFYLNSRTAAGVTGEETYETQGNNHIEYGQRSPTPYNSTPPSSGYHYGNLAAWDIYEDPIRYEQLVHNLEDGGVVVYYQCEEACPDLVEQLTDLVTPYIDGGRHVILLPNRPDWTVGDGEPLHQDMGARIALTAWTKVLKLDEFDADKIDHFIRRYVGIDHHPGRY